MRTASVRDTLVPTLSLFASTATLLCCALPALLVTLGLGAAMAGLVSTAPWLVALSKYKVWLFAGSGLLLLVSGLLTWRARSLPCPVDPDAARACMRLRAISVWIMAMSVILWVVGFFFAFLAAGIFYG